MSCGCSPFAASVFDIQCSTLDGSGSEDRGRCISTAPYSTSTKGNTVAALQVDELFADDAAGSTGQITCTTAKFGQIDDEDADNSDFMVRIRHETAKPHVRNIFQMINPLSEMEPAGNLSVA